MASFERKKSGSSITDEKVSAIHEVVNEKGIVDHHLLTTKLGAADVGNVSSTISPHHPS